jgi:hypothetical protein
MKHALFTLIIFAVAFLAVVCTEQAPQPQQTKQFSYNDLPKADITVYKVAWRHVQTGNIRPEVAKLFRSVTPYAAAQLRDIYTDKGLSASARATFVSGILATDVARMKDYKRTTSTRIGGGDGGGYITKGCECGGTHTCEFFCAGGKLKIIITGVPDCCQCYSSLEGTGGVVDCKEGSGCEPKSVSCDMSN